MQLLERTADYPTLRREFNAALASGGREPIYRLHSVEKGMRYTLSTQSDSVLRVCSQLSEESLIVLCREIVAIFKELDLPFEGEFTFDLRPGVRYRAKREFIGARGFSNFRLEPHQ